LGYQALSKSNTFDNTAVGWGALLNSRGEFPIQNTAVGSQALYFNIDGSGNTATGYIALAHNNGAFNTGTGVGALLFNSNGQSNTAVGYEALVNNTTGDSNTALGDDAGAKLTTGSDNVCIGAGVLGVAGERNTTRIRNIYGSVATTRAVYVNSDNKIGTLSSSRRYKEDIKPMDEASETLFALSPVTFRYKKDIDGSHALSFGLIAEDVAKIDPNLITRDEGGKPQTVRYDAGNAMLLNEFLKEHRKVEEQNYKLQEQEATIAQLKSGMRTLAATVKEQDSKIQKVSDQLEVKVAVKNSINRGLTLKIPQ